MSHPYTPFVEAIAAALDSGKALALPFLLDLQGAPPIFQKGFLSGFQFVSEVAR